MKHFSFRVDPALYLSLGLAIVQFVAMALHLAAAQQNAVSVILTAVYTVVLAVLTRPVQVSAITGAIATIGTAMGAFYVHISPNWISSINAIVVGVFALILRMHVSPAPLLARRAKPAPAPAPTPGV